MRTSTIRVRGAIVCAASVVAMSVTMFAPTPTMAASEQWEHGHSHNDYNRDHPLKDALAHGFTSVEVDVFSRSDGELRIGHSAGDVKSGLSLAGTYFDPLVKRVDEEGGSVYRGRQEPVTVVIELKGTKACDDLVRGKDCEDNRKQFEHVRTFLDQDKYRPYLTSVENGQITKRALTVVISGQVPTEEFGRNDVRRLFHDGPAAPDQDPGLAFQSMANIQWKKEFADQETGVSALKSEVDKAHQRGREIRVWGAPDGGDYGDTLAIKNSRGKAWRTQLEAGVDFISTDHLTTLRDFLRDHG